MPISTSISFLNGDSYFFVSREMGHYLKANFFQLILKIIRNLEILLWILKSKYSIARFTEPLDGTITEAIILSNRIFRINNKFSQSINKLLAQIPRHSIRKNLCVEMTLHFGQDNVFRQFFNVHVNYYSKIMK